MRRFIVPGIPFALSLLLSAFTLGTRVGWQDSGFALAGVKGLGVLYPPGFVLYLLVAKAWTLLFGFLDFTLAVHLFSAVCVASAAATLSVAARDLLRSKGALFGVGGGDHDRAAIGAGCLAASGFSVWSAALLAKGYALYYLVLALLLWRMIRADETDRPRDWSWVAVLIGLSWAAHPSAAGLGLALILFVAVRGRSLGTKGIAVRVGIAAACAIGPSLLLPLLAARHPEVMFGNPTSVGEWLRYLTGSRFVGLTGVFGLDGWRFGKAGRYLWEDFLLVGSLLAIWGLRRLARVNRRLLIGIAAWVLPSALLAVLFRIEGQLDFWLVAAWLPLHLAVAVGLTQAADKLGKAVLVGLAIAVYVNGSAVSQRTDPLAEAYGRFHLDHVDRDAILILDSDDTLATTQYLQVVRGLRPDVVLASASRFGSGWYERHLQQRHPRLKGGATLKEFVEANAASPIYFENVPPEFAGADLVPAGPLLRLGPAPAAAPWVFPVTMDEVRRRFGRERGIRLQVRAEGLVVEAEPYEQRWIGAFVRAQAQLAQVCFRKGGDENLRQAIDYFEAARSADPDHPDRDVIHGLAVSYYLLKQFDRAEPLLTQLLRLRPTPRQGVRACSFLATICRTQGRMQEALRYQDQAMAIVGSDPELRREFERQSPR